MEEIISLLGQLVLIKSLSLQEGKLGRKIISWFRSSGIDVEVLDGNIFLSLGNYHGKRHLLLNAHMDVVPAEDWHNFSYPTHTDPYTPFVVDKRMYGRGTADTKAGLAAMMILARDLYIKKEIVDGFNGTVTFLFSRAEEAKTKFSGLRKVLESGKIPRPTAAVIAEPSNLEVLIGSGGILNFSVAGLRKKPKYLCRPAFNLNLFSQKIQIFKTTLPAIDRCILAVLLLSSDLPETFNQIRCISDKGGHSFRPRFVTLQCPRECTTDTTFKLLTKLSNDLQVRNGIIFSRFESQDFSLIGHPSYAVYASSVMNLIMQVFNNRFLEGSGILIDAANVLIFRARIKTKESTNRLDRIFEPLPNIEFTSFRIGGLEETFSVSCRTSVTASNQVIKDFIPKLHNQVIINSPGFRTAFITDATQPIVRAAVKSVRTLFTNTMPISVQLGASDGQIMRNIYPDLPIVLLSAGSGIKIKNGNKKEAPKFLNTSHKPDEFVDLKQVAILPTIYHKIVVEYLSLRPGN